MCEQCSKLINKYYPSFSKQDKYELLIGATCFPFCGPETLEKQLIELKEKTDGSLDQALCFADMEMDRQWRERKWKQHSVFEWAMNKISNVIKGLV